MNEHDFAFPSDEETHDSMDRDKMKAVYELVKYNCWSEDLLSGDLFTFVERVLQPREFFVLEELIRGTPEDEIVRVLRKSSPQRTFSHGSLRAMKSKIKKKIFQGRNYEVQGWIRRGKNER